MKQLICILCALFCFCRCQTAPETKPASFVEVRRVALQEDTLFLGDAYHCLANETGYFLAPMLVSQISAFDNAGQQRYVLGFQEFENEAALPKSYDVRNDSIFVFFPTLKKINVYVQGQRIGEIALQLPNTPFAFDENAMTGVLIFKYIQGHFFVGMVQGSQYAVGIFDRQGQWKQASPILGNHTQEPGIILMGLPFFGTSSQNRLLLVSKKEMKLWEIEANGHIAYTRVLEPLSQEIPKSASQRYLKPQVVGAVKVTSTEYGMLHIHDTGPFFGAKMPKKSFAIGKEIVMPDIPSWKLIGLNAQQELLLLHDQKNKHDEFEVLVYRMPVD
jgi:hypothetical protein